MITNLNPVKKPDFYFAHYYKRFIYDTIKILKMPLINLIHQWHLE